MEISLISDNQIYNNLRKIYSGNTKIEDKINEGFEYINNVLFLKTGNTK